MFASLWSETRLTSLRASDPTQSALFSRARERSDCINETTSLTSNELNAVRPLCSSMVVCGSHRVSFIITMSMLEIRVAWKGTQTLSKTKIRKSWSEIQTSFDCSLTRILSDSLSVALHWRSSFKGLPSKVFHERSFSPPQKFIKVGWPTETELLTPKYESTYWSSESERISDHV